MVAAALLVVAAVRVLDDDSGPTSLPVKGVVELDEASATEQQRYDDILAVGLEGGHGVRQHPLRRPRRSRSTP